jgi:uracil-DNA glycosylase
MHLFNAIHYFGQIYKDSGKANQTLIFDETGVAFDHKYFPAQIFFGVVSIFTQTKKRMKRTSSQSGMDEKPPKEMKFTLTSGPYSDMEKYLTEPSWKNALKEEFTKTYFIQLKEELNRNVEFVGLDHLYPSIPEIFTAFNLCPLDRVRVVILGQDPYHTPGYAHGLAFSVKPGVAVPPSLANIFKELSTDITGFKKPKNGNLNGWAQQGVFLLNTVLTVRKGSANSHASYGWQKFTDRVIEILTQKRNNLVFLLWGVPAQKKESVICNRPKHRVFKTKHPSPLSAHTGFFGCSHFSKCNNYLKKQDFKEIDWQQTDNYVEPVVVVEKQDDGVVSEPEEKVVELENQ